MFLCDVPYAKLIRLPGWLGHKRVSSIRIVAIPAPPLGAPSQGKPQFRQTKLNSDWVAQRGTSKPNMMYITHPSFSTSHLSRPDKQRPEDTVNDEVLNYARSEVREQVR